jgi:hypothetical protein
MNIVLPGIKPFQKPINTQPSGHKDITPQVSLPSVNKADTLSLQFSGKRVLPQPTTISQSRFKNDRIALDANNLVPSLVEKLDEMMTVTGEAFSKNEAFTTLIDLSLPKTQPAPSSSSLNAKLEGQVDHAINVGKTQNVGIMVLSSKATAKDGSELATARATFNAIDPESVKAGALKPVPVTPLTLGEADLPTNAKSAVWNNKLSGFYKNVGTRLGAKDPNKELTDLAQSESGSDRLVNGNVYVTPQMLNKKKTGHGGVAVGMALKDMEELVSQKTGGPSTFTRVSASYLDKFVETDALQFETTVDHADSQGNVILSSRISKLDTKGQVAQGPIILIHAKVSTGGANVSIDTQSEDSEARRLEAIEWSNLPA